MHGFFLRWADVLDPGVDLLAADYREVVVPAAARVISAPAVNVDPLAIAARVLQQLAAQQAAVAAQQQAAALGLQGNPLLAQVQQHALQQHAMQQALQQQVLQRALQQQRQ
jgi:hypothetical protein